MKSTLALIALLTLTQNGADPAATLNGFVAAIKGHDFKKVADYVVSGRQDSVLAYANRTNTLPISISIYNLKVKTNGDSAFVTYDMTSGTTKHVGQKAQLIKIGGAWKLLPFFGNDKSHLHALSVLAGQATQEHVVDDKRYACLLNIGKTASGALKYAKDQKGKLNLTTANYAARLKTYVISKRPCTCPFTNEAFAFNDSLTGRTLASIGKPSQTVLFYEGKGGKLSFRHQGKANVAFADSTARSLTPEEAKNLIWK